MTSEIKLKTSRKYRIPEERILQISNDIAEDMGCFTKPELIECVKYWQDSYCKASGMAVSVRTEAVLFSARAIKEIQKGLKKLWK
jgi:propanediol dehydratase small subunit